ncbi:MAG: DUF4412 domain-containing protein [Acidobacteria bacterium]|nr:MAG: DUF4412 domain-containing protein [Acidobacteriota bacterium]
MTKKLVVALVAALAFSAPLRAAELKYTMHMEAKAAANAANDPMSQMAGGMIAGMFPAGGLDQVVIAGEKGVRSEQKQDFAMMKAGSVVLIKPDGTQFVLDPSTKTYWKQPLMPAEAAAMFAQMNPKLTVGPRGTFETFDGMKCEHLTLTMTMGIPGVDPSQLPPGMPAEISMTYDVWLTDAVKMPAAASTMSMGMLKQFGFDQMPDLKALTTDGRMMVKGVMSMFGVEMIMTSKGITTESVAPELFDVPKDYKEVPPPIR